MERKTSIRFTLGKQSSLAPDRHLEHASKEEEEEEEIHPGVRLMYSANEGNLDGIRELLDSNVDVNFRDIDNRTALHVAACQGYSDVVCLLLDNGAEVDPQDRWGSTPLADAMHYKNHDVIKLLEKRGAKPLMAPMHVNHAREIPEYEINPDELDFTNSVEITKVHNLMMAAQNYNSFSLRSLMEKEKLSGTNFLDWSRTLRIVLRQEMKDYILDTPLPANPPGGRGVTTQMVEQYDRHVRDDRDVSCLMLGAMVSELQKQFMEQHAYDIMDQLAQMFQDQARQERYLTTKALFNTAMAVGTSVSTHVLKLKGYVDTLARLGSPVPQELAVDIILGSLPESFNQFVLNYNMQGQDKTIVELHGMLKFAEQFIKRTPEVLLVKKANGPITKSKAKSKVKTKALKVKSKAMRPAQPKVKVPSPDDVCHGCNEKGHWKNACSKLREEQAKTKAAASGTKK